MHSLVLCSLEVYIRLQIHTHTLELKIIFHELGGEWIEDKEGEIDAVGINIYAFKKYERSNGMIT